MSRVLTVLQDIASAVEYMHSKRIAHGDLNPNNVLLQVCALVHLLSTLKIYIVYIL